MKFLVTVLVVVAVTVCFASKPDEPKFTYPNEGISSDSFSNVCQSIVRQLPDEATIIIFQVYTTDKVIVVTTSEPTQAQTNMVLHVFNNDGKEWKHIQSHLKRKTNVLGLTRKDLQNILSLFLPHLSTDERILVFIFRDDNEINIITGGLGGPLGGRGNVFVFKKEDDKWIFKSKGRWIS